MQQTALIRLVIRDIGRVRDCSITRQVAAQSRPVRENGQLNGVALHKRLVWTCVFCMHLCRKVHSSGSILQMENSISILQAMLHFSLDPASNTLSQALSGGCMSTSILMSWPAVMKAVHCGSTTTVLMSSISMAGPSTV